MPVYYSVIVPIYKVEPYLRQCVDSILAQTYPYFELILVDDGSPDGCPAICDEYAEQDRRIRVIHKKNGGLVSAWKAGLRAARGDYVGFVDSDDWVDTGFFEELYRRAEETGADVVVGEHIREGDDPPYIPRTRAITYAGQTNINRMMELFFTSYLFDEKPDRPMTNCRWDKLYRRELLVQNMDFFSEKISLAEDIMINAAVLPDCRRVEMPCCAERYHYRVLPGSMAHDYYSKTPLKGLPDIHQTLSSIASAKGVDTALVDALVGHMAYSMIYHIAALPDISFYEKRCRIKGILVLTPPGALAAYTRVRTGLFSRVYCWLLVKGAAGLCVKIAMLHAGLQTKRLPGSA